MSGIPGVPISLGESINVPAGSVHPMRRQNHGRSTSECGTGSLSHLGRLPPAVAHVPADHVRGYVHSKRVHNKYLVGSTLGEGSFAKVKEAFHIQVGEKVAMKVIDKKKAQQDPYVAKNFRREARLLQMVRHPNILHLMEVIETDTSFYLITELCSGGELMKHIYSKGKLDETETRKYMRQIISAVDHLHRAGIIHRDLKVENMLLDGNMDLKIIDFGLSNEEFVQGDTGKIHCSTQCGSPAYAAPELLGHKKYGPEVDIWSIGVNMYAMLTGCLPYTVEPFNITALHAKMLENKMNPIPESLSANCKVLLRRLLEANPEQRIKMDEIMSHPWINGGHSLPFGPAPFPNRLTLTDINNDIVDHMVHVLKIDSSEDDLKQELMTNKATSSACVYFLLSARLKRYQKSYAARKTSVRPKISRYSQDYDDGDDDDVKSIRSMPTRRPITRQPRATNVPLRERKGREGTGDRVFSHPPLNDVPEGLPPTFNPQRRQSLPHTHLSSNLKQFHESKRKTSSLTRPKTRQKPTERVEEYEDTDHLSLSHNDTLGPVYPSKGMHRNYSQGHALSQLRQDLQDKLHPPHTVQTAWKSNPGSRNASRQGSRMPSSKSSSRNSSMQHGLNNVPDDDELIFHPTEMSQTLPRSFKPSTLFSLNSPESEEPRLPSLNTRHTHPPHHPPHHPDPPQRRNGFSRSSNGNTYEFPTDRSVEEILAEILRVAGNFKMRESEMQGNTVNCYWKGVRFGILVTKEKFDSITIKFVFRSNVDIHQHKDIRTQLLKKLNVV